MMHIQGWEKVTSEINTALRPLAVEPGWELALMVSVTVSPGCGGMLSFCSVVTPSCSDCSKVEPLAKVQVTSAIRRYSPYRLAPLTGSTLAYPFTSPTSLIVV